MSEIILEVQDLLATFSGVTAVDHINLKLERGRIYGLIGTNGAGKSTVINLLSGSLQPAGGNILFNGKKQNGRRADQIALSGISRTFQNLRIFADQTVLDNVITAAQHQRTYTLPEMLLSLPRYRKEERNFREEALEQLRTMKIEPYADWEAGNLPYGLQRRLEIARCLAMHPRLLLLDEPAAGMNPQESLELVEDIRHIHAGHPEMTILLIEHDMKVVMNLCSYIYVMSSGKVIAEGTPSEISCNQAVITAYLGGKHVKG